MPHPMRLLPLFAVLLLTSACGSPGTEPALPGFENLDRSASDRGSKTERVDRVGSQQPASAAKRGTEANAENPAPAVEKDPQARKVGAVIVECDKHLRTWSELMSQPRDAANQDAIHILSVALGAVVAKNRALLEEQCIGGVPRNRGIATAALGFSGDPAVLPLLMNNAADPDVEIAAKALLAAGVLASPETPLAPLHNAAIRPDASEAMVRNAAFALFQIAEKTRVDQNGGLAMAFLDLLRAPDEQARAQSALGLGLIRASAALPEITDLLAADPTPGVRTAAAWALGQIGLRASTSALIRALSDPDQITAGTARGALVRIHGRDYGASPAAWKSVEGS